MSAPKLRKGSYMSSTLILDTKLQIPLLKAKP